MYNYTITKVEPEGSFPSGPLGGDWWSLLYVTGEVSDPTALWCPERDAPRAPGWTDYRGPRQNANLIGADDPLGGDIPGNHGVEAGAVMNWVAKSGDVRRAAQESVQWRWVLSRTRN